MSMRYVAVEKKINIPFPKILVHLSLALAILSFWSCTRDNGNKTQIRLDLSGVYHPQANSKSQGKVSASSATERVAKVAINVHGDAKLIEGGWESCHCLPDGQEELPPTNFTLNVTEGSNRLVQVLIVTDTEDGRTYFSYGDKLMNIVKGDNVVDITVNTTMQSEESAEAGVRYIRADGTGPSGLVDLVYRPPLDRPAMVVHSLAALGGWMRIHLFANTALDYRVRATGESLLAGVNFSHPDFAPSNRMMRVKYPAFYADKEHQGAPPYQLMSAGNVYLGYVGPGASSQVVCYDSADGVSISKAWLDSSGTNHLLWSGSTANASHFYRVGGGVNEDLTACTSATDYVGKLTLHYDQMEGDWASPLFGFENGFQLLKGTYGPSIATSFYQAHISASQISWHYLPGTTTGSNSIAGARIFTRVQSSTSGSSDFHIDGDRFDCSVLPGLGFAEVGNVLSSASSSFLLKNLNFSGSSYYQAMICPYNQAGQFIIGAAGQVHDLGGGLLPLGNGADGDRTISTSISSPSTDTSLLGGKILMAKRDLASISNDGRTLQLAGSTLNSPYTEFDIGDEIAWMVLAESGPNGCGSELNPGRYGFNEVESLTLNPPALVLRAPMVLNGASVLASSLQSTSVIYGTDFCRVFIQRVPHFNNLTLDATSAVTSLDAPGLPYSLLGGGGFLAFRVLGDMTFVGNNNFLISASGNAFGGGSFGSVSSTGYGYWGRTDNTLSPTANAGGSLDLYGGGGGGGTSGYGGSGGGASGSQAGGQGGQSSMSLFCGGNCDPYTYLFFGGGGGSGNPSGSSGGQAGGAILISANRIQRTSGTGSVYIRADGTNGINQSATDQDSGGGGGGGTLFINTKELNTTLNLSATGGPGGNSTVGSNARGGGGGGGGFIYAQACSGTGSFPTPDVSGGTAGTGTESNGAQGNSGIYQTNMSSGNSPLCYY